MNLELDGEGVNPHRFGSSLPDPERDSGTLKDSWLYRRARYGMPMAAALVGGVMAKEETRRHCVSDDADASIEQIASD